MKQLQPSRNKHHWPRNRVKSIECRKRDLVVRITDWLSDKDEPAYDVEVYVGGVYDWNLSRSFTLHEHKTAAAVKDLAVLFAQKRIKDLL